VTSAPRGPLDVLSFGEEDDVTLCGRTSSAGKELEMPKLEKVTVGKSLRVGMNAVISGSKKLSRAEKEALEVPDSVRVIVLLGDSDLEVEGAILDMVVPFGEFSTGSVGYKIANEVITLP
jgi:hypothetical protein